jgi:prepilin-type N-terminal cleavage/methylation domain-containing protein
VLRQRGFTLIELMVSLLVASLAIAFIFRIYATSSVAYRTQSQVSELQQTLRIAKEQLTFDLRMAGFNALDIQTANNPSSGGFAGGGQTVPGGYRMNAIAVNNESNGPDTLRVVYANSGCTAQVPFGAPAFATSPSSTIIKDNPNNCFTAGTLVMAIRTANGSNGTKAGAACILMLTGATPLSLSFAASGAWNTTSNTHCGNVSPDWSDGYVTFMKVNLRAYRIKVGTGTTFDPLPAGILQLSPSGGMASNDWEDLAFGFIDLQITLQRYEDADAVDSDGDGDATKDFLSGENMESPTLISGNNTLLQARVTLVARTLSPIEGVGTIATPNLAGTPLSNNPIGDHPATTLPSGPGIVDYAYRTTSTIVDLRNVGANR